MAKKINRKSNLEEIKSQLVSVKTELKDGIFIFTGPMTIAEFTEKIKKPANEVVAMFFKKGKMYNLNHSLSEEEIAELCLEYGFDFQKETEINASNFMDEIEIFDEEKEMQLRAPIITIMGHVDHGKTTLLDKIRKTNVADGEAGGITQHTGAYQIEFQNRKITFLDTPGHEAFTEMRSRGAKITDIVVLVVAADDGVMPQTIEAISHAKNANVPIIVFVNKMDKQNTDIEKLKSELSVHNIMSEEWGGDNMFIYGSGKTGKGISELFEAINLQADILDLKANRNRYPIGTVVESRLDKGKGAIATLIIQNGTLYPRDFIVAGSKYGKIRTMEDSNGKPLEKAYPGTPVVITGLNYIPLAGDRFFGFTDEKFAKNLAEEKAFTDKQTILKERNSVSFEDGIKLVNIIIKSDVFGTSEAIKSSLEKLKNDEAVVNVVHSSVGEVTKADILLAQASNAIIYAFNSNVPSSIKQFANQEKIEIKEYSVIYKIIEEVEALLKGFKAPKYEERKIGEALVLKLFYYSKVGYIAGSTMLDGKFKSGCKVKVLRKNKIIHTGKLDSLRKGPNDVKEVASGMEFGCHIAKFDDIQVDDIIQAFEEVLIEE
ncbi:translation initiation factor IF-2 [Mesomycoplasma lagogenitalium]|uniref:Translation initiation factor IF-2 n=1 Tax=Mesomycoplasma lagogenitalium TaxID=171286 RepID=A0ABY8LT01_9BACT|nr:translation initiation factor IF-2 [Mesomycoplasma lagogenitalium]WGI36379.1 translation initiation factor IF-2 [Mesomycoplasma lagogenitalium]